MNETREDETDDVAPFRCEVSYVGERAVILARGEVDVATAPSLLREVRACLELSVRAVTVDLRHVTFLDSAGIQVLLTAHKETADHGRTFTLASVPSQPRTVLEVTGLAEMFGLVTRPGGVLHQPRGLT